MTKLIAVSAAVEEAPLEEARAEDDKIEGAEGKSGGEVFPSTVDKPGLAEYRALQP